MKQDSFPKSLSRITGIPFLATAGMFTCFCLFYWVMILRPILLKYFYKNKTLEEAKKRMRRDMTEVTSWLLLAILLLAVYRVLDVAGITVYDALCNRKSLPWSSAATFLFFGCGTLLRYFGPALSKIDIHGQLRKRLLLLATEALGVTILVIYLVALSTFSYWCIYRQGTFHALDAWVYFAVCLVLSWFLGQKKQFLNESRWHEFYTARLIRTFLGATNPERCKPENMHITHPLPGDDPKISEYKPYERGGPLHIINTTLNETVSGRSGLLHRDRKGTPLALSPLVMSVGVRHHAVLPHADVEINNSGESNSFHVFPEGKIKAGLPSLGNWIGISGAAVSSGMGAYSTLGRSMLTTFFNLRLGFLWNSEIVRKEENDKFYLARIHRCLLKRFFVQVHLIDEFLGRFFGAWHQYWNLTDGGHFENTGVYELLRRKLLIIICVDASSDPNYELNDLATLIRLARTDLNAHIHFPTMELVSVSPAKYNVRDFFPNWEGIHGYKVLKKKLERIYANANGYFGNLSDFSNNLSDMGIPTIPPSCSD